VDSTPAPENRKKTERENGIALAMVLAAISVLSILVTEFTYIAQVNQKMAFDGLDQLKAHYLAKSGLKISLLRLKAYQNVKGVIGSLGGGDPKAKSAVPRQILDRLWSFPFLYPIPTNIPGLSLGDKEQIEKFQKESGLEGSFSALIESESSKYNLNMILAPFAPNPAPTVTPTPGPSPTAAPRFNPEEARKSLSDYLFQILSKKVESDPEFADEYRDFRVDDLVDNIAAWADPTYERRTSSFKEKVPMKRGPFYSLSELHMIPGMDDRLYELFAPALTVSTTPGINVNTMKEPTLRALVPQITDEETKEFFKFRDSEEEDNSFKETEDFFKYLRDNISSFRHSEEQINQLKESLTKRHIRIVVDETEFKITVRAQVNQSTRLLEAWVTLTNPAGKNPGAKSPFSPSAPIPPPPGMTNGATNPTPPDSGLRITFMRIL
jgi:general secretion pathway protein K